MIRKIPITIITGFLGSGKTTLILNLIPQLPKTYKLALLKNEFGDVAVDSQLATSSAISGVQELLNGCICCNLVGQLSDALETLARDIWPDRIVIETSGSAFPATLAMEVNRLAETTGKYILDGVVSVIDVENWKGYEDTSITAKMQAKYTDVIVLNKWELVSERRLEDVEDAVLALEVDPPIPRTKSGKGWVSKDIMFGLDAKLVKGLWDTAEDSHGHDHDHSSEVEVLSITLSSGQADKDVDVEKLQKLLEEPTKDAIYRIKGIIYTTTPPKSSNGQVASTLDVPNGRSRYILNWAFGRWTFTQVPSPSAMSTPVASESTTPLASGQTTPSSEEPELRLTVITARYESNQFRKLIESRGFVALTNDATSTLDVQKIL
ncbi:unnamed protein product [Periconia digitata]|uniref:CobW/HypB/UreG nucleotide-binding domain-containing protein n=1 Tax=Periconia digitata TaxID=1303443 RepID=A0A9W4URT6_9PLEO|nr:unnamed protein product [Periconia digitata]